MPLQNDKLLKLLEGRCAKVIIAHHVFRNLLTIDVLANDILPVISFIRTENKLDFSLFIDISGVDYLEYQDENIPERFAVIYIFYSFKNDCRIKIRAFVSEENLKIDSIYNEYKGADLTEREVYDMYGIHFTGHPNLKRLLMPENYGAHPLRKDYPLKGRGERTQFPKYNIYNTIKD